jgi:hypothetical protein
LTRFASRAVAFRECTSCQLVGLLCSSSAMVAVVVVGGSRRVVDVSLLLLFFIINNNNNNNSIVLIISGLGKNILQYYCHYFYNTHYCTKNHILNNTHYCDILTIYCNICLIFKNAS